MTSPSDPNLEPSAEKVRLYLDHDDQQIVIGALLQFLNSCEFNKQTVVDNFADSGHDPAGTTRVFDEMTDRATAILSRLQ